MKEIKSIISTCNSIDWTTTKAALATVVRVEGSSYRRTGARMLVMDDGSWVGGISGGCLEGDALKRAKLAIYNHKATLITYDTTQDDEHQIGVGLGCNGIIDVLFCPINHLDKQNPVEVLKACLNNQRHTNIIITVTSLKGDFAEVTEGIAFKYDEKEAFQIFGEFANEVIEIVNKQTAIGHSAPKQINRKLNSLTIFIEILPPEIHIILFGFQYDVYPLARLAKEMGWAVTVVANPFKINKLLQNIVDYIVSPETFSSVKIDDYTATILMSHDYKTDKNNLKSLIKSNSKYIGMLGPKLRSEKIIKELKTEGFEVSVADFKRIYAPVGLDIGAVSPEEIALSLISEIRAVFSNRNGESLKNRTEPIHERS